MVGNLVFLRWRQFPPQTARNVDGCPTHQHYQTDLVQKIAIDSGSIQVISEQNETQSVDKHSKHLGANDVPVDFMNGREDIEQF